MKHISEIIVENITKRLVVVEREIMELELIPDPDNYDRVCLVRKERERKYLEEFLNSAKNGE